MPLKPPRYDNNVVMNMGGIVVSIVSETPLEAIAPSDPFYPFLCSEPPELRVSCGSAGFSQLHLPGHSRLYADGEAFNVYRHDGNVILTFGLADSTDKPCLIAVSSDGFREVSVSTYSARGAEFSADVIAKLLQYPLLSIILIYSLAAKGGLMVHACGIDDSGKGYLFAGKCEDGKSTMARLWKDRGLVLNDEHVVIRRDRGRFWLYGTPWTGEHGNPSLGGVPLEGIFFLSHADKNGADHVQEAHSAALLLARSFPPLWDQQAMNSCLDFISDLVSEVPCYTLGFVPTNEVVDFVRCLI